MSLQTATIDGPAVLPARVPDGAFAAAPTLRTARAEEAAAILALIETHLEEGHLLPRTLTELTLRAVSRKATALEMAKAITCARKVAPSNSAKGMPRRMVGCSA